MSFDERNQLYDEVIFHRAIAEAAASKLNYENDAVNNDIAEALIKSTDKIIKIMKKIYNHQPELA